MHLAWLEMGWLQLPVDSENTSESDTTDKTIGVLYLVE